MAVSSPRSLLSLFHVSPLSPPVSMASAEVSWSNSGRRASIQSSVLLTTLLLATHQRNATETSWGFHKGVCVTTAKGKKGGEDACSWDPALQALSHFSHHLPSTLTSWISFLHTAGNVHNGTSACHTSLLGRNRACESQREALMVTGFR